MTQDPADDIKVSVVLPVHNAAPYLAAALRSVLEQSFTAFEVLAVDDGSQDASPRILEEFVQKDARLTVIRQENQGISAALNAGIAAARGTYIARMDADDIAYPDRFLKQVTHLEHHPDLVALGTQIRLVDPIGRPLRLMPLPQDHTAIDRRLLQHHNLTICHPSAMIRRQSLMEIGGYSSDYPHAEDIDLWLRLAEVGALANLPDVLLDYRMHLASTGMTKRQQQIDSAHQAALDAARRRGQPASAVGAPTRAQAETDSVYERWAWWALNAGHIATARHYAGRALRAAPFSRRSWHVMLITLRGY